jgi:hypothetical protein
MLEHENAVALRERQTWSLPANVVGRRHCRDALVLKVGENALCLHDGRNAQQFHDPLVVVVVAIKGLHDAESCMRFTNMDGQYLPNEVGLDGDAI